MVFNGTVLTKMNTLQLNLLNSINTHAYITHTSTYTLY